MRNETAVGEKIKEVCGIVKGVFESSGEVSGPGVMEQIERLVEDGGREIMRLLFEQALGEWIGAHAGEAKRCGCGLDQNKGFRTKDIVTHWGVVRLHRQYRRCVGCDHRDFAGDRDLGVESDGVSPRLRQTVTLLGTLIPFEQVPAVLRETFGLSMTAKQSQRITENVGADVVWMEESRRPVCVEKKPPAGKKWYVMVDANSVNTREGWKCVRNAVLRTTQGEGTRYVADLTSYDEFGANLRRYAAAAGIRRTDEVIALGDGLEANWKLVRMNFPGAREVLDFYHAAERIWETGRIVYGEGNEACREWCRQQSEQLKEKGPAPLIEELRRRIPRQHDPEKRKALAALCRYIYANRNRMDYPLCLRDGLLIGSGPVESACKGVTAARLKGPGMRWAVDNVRRMAHLRAIYKSGLWNHLWQQRSRALAA